MVKKSEDVLTETLAAIPKLPTPPGANMIQFPALLPGMPAPPAIPALPGMEKVPPPPGVKIVDATGKVVIAGPEISKAIPKPPELPQELPEVAEIQSEVSSAVPKEKLGEEEVENLLETEGGIELPPSAEEVSGEDLTPESIEEVEMGMQEGELTGEELII